MDVPFAFSLKVWGCYVAGDITEQDALIAEEGTVAFRPIWDGTLVDLRQLILTDKGVRLPVRHWWALPHCLLAARDEAEEQESR